MARLFAGNAGTVAVIRNTGVPALLRVQGFSYTSAFVNTIAVGHQCNVQIQPSLRQALYLYAFGDQMGTIKIQGTAFMGRLCEGRSRIQADGAANVFNFYAQNRIVKTGTPVLIGLGRTVLRGFLIGMQVATKDPINRIFTFELSFVAVPDFEGFEPPSGSRVGSGRPRNRPAVSPPRPPLSPPAPPPPPAPMVLRAVTL